MLGHGVPQDVSPTNVQASETGHTNGPPESPCDRNDICICVPYLIIADIRLKTSVSFTLYIYVSICVKRYWLTQEVGTEPI